MKFTRRQALVGLTGSALLPAGCATTGGLGQRFANDRFRHGVASGDPAPDSVVLWTRVSGFSDSQVVHWQLASDADMLRIVARGETVTGPARDHTVKVVPQGLFPGRTYYYRFQAGGEFSPIGRTRTLPVGPVERLVLAAVSCSNYPFGHFNGYQAIAEDPDIDLVVHLGDYIYEYGEDGYGGESGRRLGRVHEPRHETVSLDDYRVRHAQYKAEPGSLAMHAMHPLIHTWDDHESTNNPWHGGAQNHQPDEGLWHARRQRSLRAYYEWMPVRDPQPGQPPEQRWAHFRFGDLASLYTLESRHTARSEQIDLAEFSDRLKNPASARAFYEEVVGAPGRRMLSREMEDFLGQELRESVGAGRRWRVLANQTILANVVMPDVDDPVFRAQRSALSERYQTLHDNLTAMGRLELPGNMDAWDGYPAARERLYWIAESAGARDLLVLTGDTHVFWQNQLFSAAGLRMGVELGTSAITSPRGFHELGDTAMHRYDELVAGRNDGVVWADGRQRGFVRLSLTPERAVADYVVVSTIESPEYSLRTLKSVGIRREGGTLVYA